MDIQVIDMTGAEPREMTLTMPRLPEWSMAKELGYEPQTTFWQDFSIADLYGAEAIVDTFKRAVKEWHDDVIYVAELALVLNHKGAWYYAASERHGDDPVLKAVGDLYYAMWEKLHDYARDHFKGDDEEYYFRITD